MTGLRRPTALSKPVNACTGTGASSPAELLSTARNLVVGASQQGTVAFASWINGTGAYIYRVGNDFLIVAKEGVEMLSYVVNAMPGTCVSLRAITSSKHSRRALPAHLSATPFCQGLRMLVRTGFMADPRSLLAPV